MTENAVLPASHIPNAGPRLRLHCRLGGKGQIPLSVAHLVERVRAPATYVAQCPAGPSPAPIAPPSLQLIIRAKEDSWLSDTTDGVTQREVMLLAGSDKTVQVHKDILLKAGNVGGLTFVCGAKLPSQ